MRLLKNLLVFLVLILSQAAVSADDRKYLTIDEMASRIQKQSGAQILSAEILQGKHGKLYRFKVKKKGRVRVMLMHPDGTPVNRK